MADENMFIARRYRQTPLKTACLIGVSICAREQSLQDPVADQISESPVCSVFASRITKQEEREPNEGIQFDDDIFEKTQSSEIRLSHSSQNSYYDAKQTKLADLLADKPEVHPENQESTRESPLYVERYPMLSASLISHFQSKSSHSKNSTSTYVSPSDVLPKTKPASNPHFSPPVSHKSKKSGKKRKTLSEPFYMQMIEKRWKESNEIEGRLRDQGFLPHRFGSDWLRNFESKWKSPPQGQSESNYRSNGDGYAQAEQMCARRSASSYATISQVQQTINAYKQNSDISNAFLRSQNANFECTETMQRLQLPAFGGSSVAAPIMTVSVSVAPPKVINMGLVTRMASSDTMITSSSRVQSLGSREALAAQLLHALQREQKQIAGGLSKQLQPPLIYNTTSSTDLTGCNNNGKQFDAVAANLPPRCRQIHELIRHHSNYSFHHGPATSSSIAPGIRHAGRPGHQASATAQFSNPGTPGIRIPPPGNCRMSWQMNGLRPTLTVDVPMYIIQTPISMPMLPTGQRLQHPRISALQNLVQQYLPASSPSRIA